METVAEHIHDGRFLRLIRELLQAGYVEEWKYNATLSGAPQGGSVTPHPFQHLPQSAGQLC